MNKHMAQAIAAAMTAASLFAPLAVQAQTAGTTGQSGSAAGSSAASTGMGSSAAKSGDARGANLAASDRRFMMEAAQSDMAELMTSKMAQQKGQSDAVKQYAQMMITDHTATSEKLTSMAQAKGVTLPTDVDGKHKRMAAKLEKAEGARFDREYMQGQVKAHQDAVKLFERQAKNGRDEDLKQFATATLPRLREHLQMAQKGSQGAAQSMKSGAGDRSATAGASK